MAQEAKFSCVCNRTFARMSSLKRHQAGCKVLISTILAKKRLAQLGKMPAKRKHFNHVDVLSAEDEEENTGSEIDNFDDSYEEEEEEEEEEADSLSSANVSNEEKSGGEKENNDEDKDDIDEKKAEFFPFSSHEAALIYLWAHRSPP